MKNSKRVRRIIGYVDTLENDFEYFANGKMPKEYREYFNEIKDLIDELSQDRKLDHARFAKKLKGLWRWNERTKGNTE